MTVARSEVVVEGIEAVYHCVSRCVRRVHLCGYDDYSGKSYEHRKEWVRRRLERLASVFAVEVAAYAVMSNHVHVVLRTRPDWIESWTAEDTARRWLTVFNKGKDRFGGEVEPDEQEIRTLAGNAPAIAETARRLGSVSWFMRCLNEYIARRANREDGCHGRFWAERFHCQAILDESAALACLTYVDLNPVRAGVARTPEESRYTSVYERIEAKRPGRTGGSRRNRPKNKGTRGWLCPIGLEDDFRRGLTSLDLDDYLTLLDWTGRLIREDKRGAIPANLAPILDRLRIHQLGWVDTVRTFGRMFHGAAGRADSLAQVARRKGLRWLRGMGAGGLAFSKR